MVVVVAVMDDIVARIEVARDRFTPEA